MFASQGRGVVVAPSHLHDWFVVQVVVVDLRLVASAIPLTGRVHFV